MMNLPNTYEGMRIMQQSVREFLESNQMTNNEQIRYLDLVSDVGELGKEILKSTDYGKRPYVWNENAVEEMGDCLFSILALCCEMGIDAEKALAFALEKYNRRLSSTGSIGSGR